MLNNDLARVYQGLVAVIQEEAVDSDTAIAAAHALAAVVSADALDRIATGLQPLLDIMPELSEEFVAELHAPDTAT